MENKEIKEVRALRKTTANLNMRRNWHTDKNHACTCCPVVKTLPKGTVIETYTSINGWSDVFKYKVPGGSWVSVVSKDYWVSTQYLTIA